MSEFFRARREVEEEEEEDGTEAAEGVGGK